MEKVNKKQILQQISSETKVPIGVCQKVVDGLIDAITYIVKNDGEATLFGFGTFKTRKVAGMTVSHPITKEKVEIPEHRAPLFVPGTRFRNVLKEKDDA